MDSFFFNITDTSYKITKSYENKEEHITRVDISNGIVFFDIYLNSQKEQSIHVKNLDRMVAIPVTKKGSFKIEDHIGKKCFDVKNDSISIFTSSRQDITLTINETKETEIFVLFIADFIFKRYLSSSQSEVINFLYNNVQEEVSCELIDTQPIDALSLYIIDKIINTKSDTHMNSIRCEHNVLEFMIHRFDLLDMIDDELSDDEICISRSSKAILLRSFASPPTIEILAHLCATNETSLKKIFKKVYKTTIYGYVQKLRLEKANLLLKEQLLNIGEIAKEVGYKHQGHFSKLFYEHYGVYPKDLLKK
ncbi:transcriptional regulator, AraC family [Sulfurimonas gotlandica GD1]|uniref:Transcriptional regulator, AraC family n=1 Tax=Sulfurimonas gotlandica (strain DSM 19862 / JCM 16533 / GD1) TaxID=929558 RepID=B6BHF6_SULGG|nr:helix-turn-helix transcriptional regulator [Sulfurimonas gotlandica]EDZ63544.1 transcriptional regulator, AraC family [Sulfurimonas gotlandica GD1]EHP29952.1 transcriptional regulator, AraC family [Sulfurimonas gotlandica GD1]